jgi:hypothetical protein
MILGNVLLLYAAGNEVEKNFAPLSEVGEAKERVFFT